MCNTCSIYLIERAGRDRSRGQKQGKERVCACRLAACGIEKGRVLLLWIGRRASEGMLGYRSRSMRDMA